LGQKQVIDFIKKRFGTLPKAMLNWKLDNRTDIFSLGMLMYELLAGELPKAGVVSSLKPRVSKELSEIVYKCIQIVPDERYNTVRELLDDIARIKNKRVSMIRSLVMRKVAVSAAVFLLAASAGLTTGGAYIMHSENMSVIEIFMDTVVISEQQSFEIHVQRTAQNGDVSLINPNLIVWSYDNANVARIYGNRLAGLNEGSVTVTGRYRNNTVTAEIRVIKPPAGLVDVSLVYKTGGNVNLFAGSGIRERVDGPLPQGVSFVSPESICVGGDGNIYVADSGFVRVISNGEVSTLDFEPSFLRASKVRYGGSFLYVLTEEWEADGGMLYGIIKLDGSGAELVHTADANFTRIWDFTVVNDVLYFLEYNAGVRYMKLNSLDLTTQHVHTYAIVSDGARALCYDGYGGVFIADAERAVIEHVTLDDGITVFVAGFEGQRHFVDGALPFFYEPFRLELARDILYVLDYNVLRMIHLNDDFYTKTMAGVVSTDANPVVFGGNAEDVTFAYSALMDFTVANGKVLLTDPINSVVWQIIPAP
jgi:hypothetical protein